MVSSKVKHTQSTFEQHRFDLSGRWGAHLSVDFFSMVNVTGLHDPRSSLLNLQMQRNRGYEGLTASYMLGYAAGWRPKPSHCSGANCV